MKVVLLPQVSGNKGDRAVLHFMLQELVALRVEAITVATDNPYLWRDHQSVSEMSVRFVPFAWMILAEAESRSVFHSPQYYALRVISRALAMFHSTVSYAVVRGAVVRGRHKALARALCRSCNRRLWDAINEADAVITTGGHRITTLLQPDVIGSQTFGMAWVVLAGKRLGHWSQTIGGFQFKKEENRLLVKAILDHAERIYVRDEASVNQVEQFEVAPGKVRTTCDSVFGLAEAAEPEASVMPTKRPKSVGLSLYTGLSGREIGHQAYVKALAALVRRCVDDGYRVRFFPMHLGDGREKSLIEEIRRESGAAEGCEVVDEALDTQSHLREVAKCRLFIGHKTHSIIFALVSGTPLIAIAYHFKSLEFMRQYGLEEFGVREADVTAVRLVELYESLQQSLDNVHSKERLASGRLSRAAKRDFRELVECLAPG